MFTDLVVHQQPLADQILHITLEGDLCLSTLTASGQHGLVLESLKEGNNRIILDLSRVRYVDSTGVSWMIASQRQCQSADGKLALIPPTGRDSQMFHLLKLQDLLNFCQDVEEARRFILSPDPR